jgi:hypothetical protein
MRKQIYVEVFRGRRYDGDWPPGNAVGFVDWLANKIAEIPPEHRETATVELETTEEYDSHYAQITIAHERPESDLEVERREAIEARIARGLRRRDLEDLKRLKAKYEGA